MGEEERIRYFVTNHQNQPVELHLATGVLVLGPHQQAEVRADDLAAPQLAVLRQQRLLMTRTSVEPLPDVPPAGLTDEGEAMEAGGDSAGAAAPAKAKKPTSQRSRGRRDSA